MSYTDGTLLAVPLRLWSLGINCVHTRRCTSADVLKPSAWGGWWSRRLTTALPYDFLRSSFYDTIASPYLLPPILVMIMITVIALVDIGITHLRHPIHSPSGYISRRRERREGGGMYSTGTEHCYVYTICPHTMLLRQWVSMPDADCSSIYWMCCCVYEEEDGGRDGLIERKQNWARK